MPQRDSICSPCVSWCVGTRLAIQIGGAAVPVVDVGNLVEPLAVSVGNGSNLAVGRVGPMSTVKPALMSTTASPRQHTELLATSSSQEQRAQAPASPTCPRTGIVASADSGNHQPHTARVGQHWRYPVKSTGPAVAEGVLYLEDILGRWMRIFDRVPAHRGVDCAREVADVVAPVLGWSARDPTFRIAGRRSRLACSAPTRRATRHNRHDGSG
jgi:hypothetical protein